MKRIMQFLLTQERKTENADEPLPSVNVISKYFKMAEGQ